MLRNCYTCGEAKEVGKFVKDPRYPDGHSHKCLACKLRYEQARRKAIKNHIIVESKRKIFMRETFEEGVRILLERGYFFEKRDAEEYTRSCRLSK